jgi:hypothetical protein
MTSSRRGVIHHAPHVHHALRIHHSLLARPSSRSQGVMNHAPTAWFLYLPCSPVEPLSGRHESRPYGMVSLPALLVRRSALRAS